MWPHSRRLEPGSHNRHILTLFNHSATEETKKSSYPLQQEQAQSLHVMTVHTDIKHWWGYKDPWSKCKGYFPETQLTLPFPLLCQCSMGFLKQSMGLHGIDTIHEAHTQSFQHNPWLAPDQLWSNHIHINTIHLKTWICMSLWQTQWKQDHRQIQRATAGYLRVISMTLVLAKPGAKAVREMCSITADMKHCHGHIVITLVPPVGILWPWLPHIL